MNERVGYRFHPTDEELVSYFLKKKIDGDVNLVQDDIKTVDICEFDPWELPGIASQSSNDQVWYFFHHRKPKYENTTKLRYNRSTKSGKWKQTGKQLSVKDKYTKMVIGTKRTLVFIRRATPKELKTNWVIHQYELITSPPDKVGWVLCKLKKKTDTSACVDGEPSGKGTTSFENNAIEIPSSKGDQELLGESIYVGCGVDFNYPFAQQPHFLSDQASSIDSGMFFSGYDDGMALHFDTNELEEDLDEMVGSFLDSPTHLICCSSSHMDAEIISERSSQFGAVNLNNHATPKE